MPPVRLIARELSRRGGLGKTNRLHLAVHKHVPQWVSDLPYNLHFIQRGVGDIAVPSRQWLLPHSSFPPIRLFLTPRGLCSSLLSMPD